MGISGVAAVRPQAATRWHRSALSAYATMLQAKGTADADEYQAAGTGATYGDLKAAQTGGQMTRRLGNIDAVRAASNADPSSPTGAGLPRQSEGNRDQPAQHHRELYSGAGQPGSKRRIVLPIGG